MSTNRTVRSLCGVTLLSTLCFSFQAFGQMAAPAPDGDMTSQSTLSPSAPEPAPTTSPSSPSQPSEPQTQPSEPPSQPPAPPSGPTAPPSGPANPSPVPPEDEQTDHHEICINADGEEVDPDSEECVGGDDVVGWDQAIPWPADDDDEEDDDDGGTGGGGGGGTGGTGDDSKCYVQPPGGLRANPLYWIQNAEPIFTPITSDPPFDKMPAGVDIVWRSYLPPKPNQDPFMVRIGNAYSWQQPVADGGALKKASEGRCGHVAAANVAMMVCGNVYAPNSQRMIDAFGDITPGVHPDTMLEGLRATCTNSQIPHDDGVGFKRFNWSKGEQKDNDSAAVMLNRMAFPNIALIEWKEGGWANLHYVTITGVVRNGNDQITHVVYQTWGIEIKQDIASFEQWWHTPLGHFIHFHWTEKPALPGD